MTGIPTWVFNTSEFSVKLYGNMTDFHNLAQLAVCISVSFRHIWSESIYNIIFHGHKLCWLGIMKHYYLGKCHYICKAVKACLYGWNRAFYAPRNTITRLICLQMSKKHGHYLCLLTIHHVCVRSGSDLVLSAWQSVLF